MRPDWKSKCVLSGVIAMPAGFQSAAAVAIAFTSMPTAPIAGTVIVAWPAAFTATTVPVHAPSTAAPLITSQ